MNGLEKRESVRREISSTRIWQWLDDAIILGGGKRIYKKTHFNPAIGKEIENARHAKKKENCTECGNRWRHSL